MNYSVSRQKGPHGDRLVITSDYQEGAVLVAATGPPDLISSIYPVVNQLVQLANLGAAVEAKRLATMVEHWLHQNRQAAPIKCDCSCHNLLNPQPCPGRYFDSVTGEPAHTKNCCEGQCPYCNCFFHNSLNDHILCCDYRPPVEQRNPSAKPDCIVVSKVPLE